MTVDDSEFQNASEHYKQLATFWTDILHLMSSKPGALASVGPMRALAANSKKITNEMIEMSEDMVAFSKHLSEYYSQLANTWGEAQKKVNQKMSDIPHDTEQIEALKRVWIDMFDNDFTELFDSPKFGSNYGKLVSKELEIVKHWNSISNTVLQSANLPSKEEIDDVYREIHSLKKRLRLSELELQRLRRASPGVASKGASGSAPAADVGGAPSGPERGNIPAGSTAVTAGVGDKPKPQRAGHAGDAPSGASQQQQQQSQPRSPSRGTQEQPPRQQPEPWPRPEQRRPDPPQPPQHRPQHQQPQQPHDVQARPPRYAPQPQAPPPAPPPRPHDAATPGGSVAEPPRQEPEGRLPSPKPDPVSSPPTPSPSDRPAGPPAQNTKNPRRRRRRSRRRFSKSERPGSPNLPPPQPESAPKPTPALGSSKDATAAVTRHASGLPSDSFSRPPRDAAKRTGTTPGGATGAPEATAGRKKRRRHRPDKHTRRMRQQQQGQSRPPQPQPTADTRPAPSKKTQSAKNPESAGDPKHRTRDDGGDSARQGPNSGKSSAAADSRLPRKDGDAET